MRVSLISSSFAWKSLLFPIIYNLIEAEMIQSAIKLIHRLTNILVALLLRYCFLLHPSYYVSMLFIYQQIMNDMILKASDRPDVGLGIISIIIGNKRIGNQGLQFLCSQ
jgi:hypothetical protein